MSDDIRICEFCGQVLLDDECDCSAAKDYRYEKELREEAFANFQALLRAKIHIAQGSELLDADEADRIKELFALMPEPISSFTIKFTVGDKITVSRSGPGAKYKMSRSRTDKVEQ